MTAAESDEALEFEIVEGDIQNLFLRRGPVAAHVLATRGTTPRLVFAFPAGNTGVGLWFDELLEAVDFAVEGPLAPVERADGMRGVETIVHASASRLRVGGAVLGSVRALRRFRRTGAATHEMQNEIDVGPPLVLRRARADGRRVEVAFVAEPGTALRVDAAGCVVMESHGEPLRLRITALADDAPLTPLPSSELLRPGAGGSRRERDALAFLCYREKLLAGSWRFLTYFGRDTLLSVELLMPALGTQAVEAALGSVLERLGARGEVAHEEDVGEWPALHGHGQRWLDYKMVDDDFLLAPVIERYAERVGPSAAAEFLARRAPDGRGYAALLRHNLELVERRARPYAEVQDPERLVALNEGQLVGQWRDSAEGLGLGRVPYDVNAALVPAALRAAASLWVRLGEPGAAARAAAMLPAWRACAAHFHVELSADDARDRILAYAREVGVDPAEAIASVTGPVGFPAIALDAVGRPLPVMHTDEGFALLFGEPDARELEEMAVRLTAPFPAGLRTPVGLLVANPAFAEPETRALFGPRHYHGTVVWSWQQAMVAAGLRRQLARDDLTEATRRTLRATEATVWRLIQALREMSTSELWSFTTRDGGIELSPFGQHPHAAPAEPAARVAAGHADESNAVQLWSTVYIAVRPPQAEGLPDQSQ